MWKTLTYLWETICLPWKVWLALLSFLLGLWFAWLLWGPWVRRFRKGILRERNLLLEVVALQRQVREGLRDLERAVPMPARSGAPAANEPVKQEGDSGLEAASLLKDQLEELAIPDEEPFGKGYRFPPEHRDDLTTLRGVDDNLQRKLNALGIYQFAQISEMSDGNIRALQSEDPKLREVHWTFWRDRLRARQSRLVKVTEVGGSDGEEAAREKADEQPSSKAKLAEVNPVIEKNQVPEKQSLASKPLAEVESVLDQEPVLDERPLALKPRKVARLKPEWGDMEIAPASPKENVPMLVKPRAIPAPVLPSHFVGEDMTLSSKFGWVYNRKPKDADDFSALAGLTPEGGELLGKLGIHKFKQIAHLKDEELNALQAHDLKLEGPEWSQWRTYFKSSDGIPRIPEALQGQPVEVSPTLGPLFREPPTKADDLSQLHGVYPSLGKSLNRSGIYRYAQVAQLNDAQIGAWEKQDPAFAKLPWHAWRKRFQGSGSLTPPATLKGEAVKWSPYLGWVFASRPKKTDRLTLIEGLGSEQVSALHGLGIYQFGQIAEWSDEEIGALENEAPLLQEIDWSYWRHEIKKSGGRLELPGGFEAAEVALSPKLGLIYTRKPANQDDLSLLQGADSSAVRKWNGSGLYRYEQIAQLSDHQIGNWQKQTASVPGFDWKGWRDQLASSGAKIEVPTEFEGEPVQVSPNLGVVYGGAPNEVDDFTLLYGVSASAAEQLNREGLYRYRQVAHLSDNQIEHWKKAAPAAGEVDWRAWRERLRSSDETIEVPSEFEGEPVQISPQLGVVYVSPPCESDDFTQLQGVSTQAAECLYQLGVYRYSQLACFGDAEVNQLGGLDDRLRAVDWKSWRAYFRTHCGAIEMPETLTGETLKLSPKLGFVYGEAPAQSDNLCRLKGIDSASGQAMNAMGLYRYEQIAQLSDTQLEAWRKMDDRFDGFAWGHWRAYFRNGQRLMTPMAFAGESIQHCPHLGVVYDRAPGKVDQLTLLQGVDEMKASLLRRLGIYRFVQIAHWDDAAIQELVSRHPELAGIRWAEWRRRFSEEGFAMSIPPAFAGEVVQLSPCFGVVYPEALEEPDQLALMNGVTAQSEKQLHELGFYRFKQIENLTDSQIDALRAEAPEFKNMGWNLWRALLSIHSVEAATSLARLRQGVPLEFADENQVYQDAELGTLYQFKPREVDSLSEIDGIDENMERLLNDYGIWTFRQLSFLRSRQCAALRVRDGRFQGFRETLHRWHSGARVAVGSHWRWRSWDPPEAHDLTSKSDSGAVADREQQRGDPLSLLPGVSGVGSALLKDMGICQFEQIVQLTDEQVSSLGKKQACLKRLNPAQLRFAASRYLGRVVSSEEAASDI